MLKFNLSQWSLKTRITLFTLVIFVLGIWSLSFYASRMLQQDMQKLLGDQQFSTASLTAEDLDEQFENRFNYLNAVASQIDPSLLHESAALQTFIEGKQILKLMFNGGAFITNTDGNAIASFPLSLNRAGTNYNDRDYIIAALKEGKSTVGKPVIGRKLNVPVFVMATPIKNTRGEIVGALAGVIDLSKPNFLDKITSSRYGMSGGYFIVMPKLRLIVAATDKSRNMQTLPARGVIPKLDRFLDGYEGSAVYINPFGTEVLGSAKKIPASDWLLGITMPITEAFTPIRVMQQRMLAAALLLTLIAAGLTWWMLRRQLSPMLTAVQTMSAMAAGNQTPQALPVTSQDEIGTLISGFNRLLETLAQRAAALKESDGRAAALIESSPLPLALNDENGNITYLNQAFIKTIGYTLDDIPTLERWWPLAYPDPQYRRWVADSWQKSLDESNRTNQPFAPLEIAVHCKDGLIRTFMASASAVEGSFSKTHLVILYDITDRKNAEQALITSTDRLNEAQLMAKIGNWTLNLPSGELIWSDEIFRIFEIDPNKFGATYEAFLNAIHPDDRDAVNQAYSSSLETRTPYEITHRLLMSDGRIKWVVEKCMSDFDADGKPLQSRGMVQDITVTKMTELALIAARDEADRANAAKSQFLSSMSHELRTPLNAVLGFAQVLDYDPDLPSNHKQSVTEIIHAGYHLLNLINEVLDLSQIESGHMELTLESVEVCAVVEESLRLVNPIANKHGIHLSHSGLEGVTVRADRNRLKQALVNLLSNGIKYNREGGSVSVELSQNNTDRLRIEVRDTGQGIPAERMAELFQPFSRLGAENSNILGAGIGLTITRRLLDAMGGTVGVESEVGVGSVFWLELPIEFLPAQAQPHPLLASSAPRSQPQNEQIQYTVLYIEDNPASIRLLTEIMTKRPHLHLLCAHTPALGIDLALAHQPDLILLDINMSEMSGYDVLQLIKDNVQLRTTPVIAVTANAMAHDIERGMEAGFSEYLIKPLDIAKFYAVVDHYLPSHSRANGDNQF